MTHETKNHGTAGVSNLGRFRDTSGIIKTVRPRSDGRCQVKIFHKCFYLSRLVCESFHGPPPSQEHTEVNHKDGNPSNNCASNLEWCTRVQNIRHSRTTNAPRHSSVDKLCKPVLVRKSLTDENWVRCASARDAARVFGLNGGNVSAVARGKYNQTGGYEIKYAVPPEPEQLENELWRRVGATTIPRGTGIAVSSESGAIRSARRAMQRLPNYWPSFGHVQPSSHPVSSSWL